MYKVTLNIYECGMDDEFFSDRIMLSKPNNHHKYDLIVENSNERVETLLERFKQT